MKFKFVVCLIFSVCFLTISSFAADASWSTTDSQNLASIKSSLTSSLSTTVLGKLYAIKESTDYMLNMNTQLNHIADILGYGDSFSTYPSLYSLIYRSNSLLSALGSDLDVLNDNVNVSTAILDSFNQWSRSEYSYGLGHFEEDGTFVRDYMIGPTDIKNWIGFMSMSLAFDGTMEVNGTRTLYSRIKQLQETLASDDDKALADAQKLNREEIESDFLSGSSGSTSLGASDFGDLSDVGGTVNDTLSLNGQASISSFTSGLADADQEGQNWFSAATRDSLDSVSGGISTFALDDPYNMEGWEEQYSWVLGGE